VLKVSSFWTLLVEFLFLITEEDLVVVRAFLEKKDLSVELLVREGFMVSSVRYMNNHPLQFSVIICVVGMGFKDLGGLTS